MLLRHQLLRYGFVGLVTNLIGYCVYLMLTHAGMEPKQTMSLVYLAGATTGFFGHGRVTFGHRTGRYAEALRYVLAHCAGYAINFLLLLVFVDIAGYPHYVVQTLAIVIVAGFLFALYKWFVFSQSNDTERGP